MTKILIKKLIKENLSNSCKEIYIPDGLKNEIKQQVIKHDNHIDFLKSGGLETDTLDRLAFGFAEDDIKEISPSKLKIKWKDDLENVFYEVKQSGLTAKQWSEKVSLEEPIDVVYENGDFYVDDGHHRYFAAKTLNKILKCNLMIKDKPLKKINFEDYDEFHRCLFNQIKRNF